MAKSFRMQQNIYDTYKMLKTQKKRQQFLEKCFIYAWENREIDSDYDVNLAFCGVKPSIKLSENGGGLNNPQGKNQYKELKEKENDISECGQSEVRVRSDLGQSFISNKDISNKNINNKDKKKKELLKFGEFKLVCLEEKKYNDYLEKYGEDKLKFGIEKLDTWLAKNPKKQKQNHFGYFKSDSWIFDGYSENKEKPKEEKKVLIEDGKFYLDDTMEDYKDSLQGLKDEDAVNIWKWIYDNFYGQEKSVEWINKVILNYKQRKGE